MDFLHHIQGYSARACRACRAPIKLNDGFGLSEGVCPPCRGSVRAIAGRPPARSLAAWLRRAA